MRIVAAAGLTLARDGLASRADAAHVRADGAAQSLWLARSIRVNVLEVVHLLCRHPSRRAISVRRHHKRNAVAPAPADLGRKQFGIDRVLVRLKAFFKSDDIRLDHLEHSEAAIQAKFPRLRHEVILSLVPQDK